MNHLRTAWHVICLLIVIALVAVSVDGGPMLALSLP